MLLDWFPSMVHSCHLLLYSINRTALQKSGDSFWRAALNKGKEHLVSKEMEAP